MKATTTLQHPTDPHSSDFRVALRALLSLRESHGVVPAVDGNCHTHDLVSVWAQLIDEPMPIGMLRQELCERMGVDQRTADAELATALLRGDVRLVRLLKRARR